MKKIFVLIFAVFVVGLLSCACSKKSEDVAEIPSPDAVAADLSGGGLPAKTPRATVPLEEDEDLAANSRMVSYDVSSIGRSDPFMPYDEYQAYETARKQAYADASAHNAEIDRIKRLQFTAVREADDISPYSFNLPVPPTELASEDAAAAKITRTKVVGIMYNNHSPSAIINVDEKDYLVRPGDKIIGQEYMVRKIDRSYITVAFGHNVYSAAIGELFSKDELVEYENDLYDLKNRFGGRKG